MIRSRLFALALLSLLLAACAPEVVYITPPVIGPAELQHLNDSATNTQAAKAAIATQDARLAAGATATDQSSRATATTARQATLDALAGQQTEAAIKLTSAAGAADATDNAAIKTQIAEQTSAWSTPTAAAIRTLQAVSAIDRSRDQAQAQDVAEFWKTVRWVLVAALAIAGIVASVLLWNLGQARIRMAELRNQASVAQAAFRILAPGHWGEYVPGEGYQVYELPGLLNAPAQVIENAPASPNAAFAWRQAVRLFCWWGSRYGFGIEHLGATGAKVVTDPAWRTLTKLLKDAGVLASVPIEKDGKLLKGRVTGWADGWNYRRLQDDLGHGRLALPFPADTDAPKVAFAVPTEQQNSGTITSQQANIEA